MNTRTLFLSGALLAVAATLTAGPVSSTPGIIKGVVHFNAPFQPDTMQVDAQDVTHTYSATGAAVQNDLVNCAAGSQNWCYSVTVESALASSYTLRPIAFQAHNNPFFVQARIPFPATAPVAITSGATVIQNIPLNNTPYQPGQISGNVLVKDLTAAALPLTSVYLSVNDLSYNPATFTDNCGGSADFCPFNSVFLTGVLSPNPPTGAPYQLFLKPGDDYNYLSRGFNLSEGPTAKTVYSWDSNIHFGSVLAGQNAAVNYNFNQVAQVTGTAQFSLPIYALQTDVAGTTTTPGGSFVDSYIADFSNSPVSSAAYLNRIFDNSVLGGANGFTIRPQFTLSADGGTVLSYPPIPFSANSGDKKVIDFNNTPASIAGRVTFDPPYPAGNIYPGIQAVASTASGYGQSQTRLLTDAQGGTYFMPVFAGNWDLWRWGWSFDLANPNLAANYFVGQYLTIPVPVAPGQAVTGQEFKFGTARVKVFFSAPPNTTLSDPQLNAVSGSFTGGNFVADFADSAHGDGLNQHFKPVAESDLVLRTDTNLGFRITPSAVINTDPNTPGTSRTDFSPIVLKPNKGDVIIIGVPGSLSLIVNTPFEGQVLASCQVPVSGTATGAANITITVNGKPVATTPAGNPNDPSQVKFSTMVAGSGPNTTITVVASAPNNTTVSDVIHVGAANAVVTANASVATPMLWPPNHDLVNVGLTTSASSACDPSPSIGVKVYSDESETAADGDGPFSPDAKNIATGTLRLRSERKGNGDGRVYLIVTTATDSTSGTGKACTSVVVPQSMSPAAVAGVQSSAAAAVNYCKANGVPPAGFQQIGSGPVVGPKQ